MVAFFNISTAAQGSNGSGGASGTTVTEILNEVNDDNVTIATVLTGGTYNVYVSTDGGVNYTLYTEGSDYSRSGQTFFFGSSLTAATVKLEFTYS